MWQMAFQLEQESQAKGGEQFMMRYAADATGVKHVFYELCAVPEIQIVITNVL
jgi:hypothetical protein